MGSRGAYARRRRLAPSAYLSLAVVAFALSACAQPAIQAAESRNDPDCARAVAAFDEAGGYFMAPERIALLPADYRATLDRAGDDDAKAHEILSDMTAEAAALDDLHMAYGALQVCHADHAAGWRAAVSKGTISPVEARNSLATERTIFRAELAEAQVLQQHAADLSAVYGAAAAGLLARRGALPPVADLPYRALASTAIHPAPDAASAGFALLRKGQRVLAPGIAGTPGWIAIDLDDGSLGYVEAAMLKPLAPNASERQAANAAPPPVAGILAELGIAVRETLPQKQAALAALIGMAATMADRAFDLPPGHPAAIANATP